MKILLYPFSPQWRGFVFLISYKRSCSRIQKTWQEVYLMKSGVESASDIKLENKSSKLRILIVVPNFYPEIGSAAHIYFDLAKGFVKRGHEVDVITSYPRKYYLDNSKNEHEFQLDEVIHGISIHRCKYAILRDNIFMRGLEHFIISRVFFKRYKKLGKKFDICLIYIPTTSLILFCKKTEKIRRDTIGS